jgi:hypothetical protein
LSKIAISLKFILLTSTRMNIVIKNKEKVEKKESPITIIFESFNIYSLSRRSPNSSCTR